MIDRDCNRETMSPMPPDPTTCHTRESPVPARRVAIPGDPCRRSGIPRFFPGDANPAPNREVGVFAFWRLPRGERGSAPNSSNGGPNAKTA